jgi:ABC-type transporter Mla subunit MlaD
MTAMIDHARATIDHAGSHAAQSIAERMDALAAQADAFGARLAEQDTASRTLVERLERALGEIEVRFETLGATGSEQTADLAELIVALSEHVDNVGAALNTSMGGVRTLSDRANALRITFDAVSETIERDMPAAMHRIEAEAARGDSAIRAVAAQAEQLAATVERATDRLDSADLLIDRQRNAVAGLGDQAARRMASIAAEGDALLDRQRDLSDSFAEEAAARLEALRDHSSELGRLIAESEKNMRSLAELSGSRLVDALLKVRETAGEAARGARAALESIIPDASEKLARSGAEAIERAFGDQITQRIHLISDTAEAAVSAANHASEKLLKQLLTIAEASANLEERALTFERRRPAPAPEASLSDNFAGEVAALVEGLKAAAIDVTRLLSTDIADTAWTAYLSGDHGVFARRAVQLLDAGEAQHLATYCDRNPAFRAQVDRYVASFEAMLARILDSRDGAPLGVTMLSSDMGKLYVALAQGIGRLTF